MTRGILRILFFTLALASCSQFATKRNETSQEASQAESKSASSSQEQKAVRESEWQWPLPSNQRRVRFFPSVSGRAFLPGRIGAHVMAVDDGKVVFSGKDLKEFGPAVVLSHEKGLFSVYGNLQKRYVKKGQKIYRGQVIGRIDKAADDEGQGELVFWARHKGRVVDFKALFQEIKEL